MQFCADHRRLNELTIPGAYRFPRQYDTMDALERSSIFSGFELSHGFHQFPSGKASRARTAFSTRRGLYQWTTAHFGIRNGPAAFQRLFDYVLAGLIFECCILYRDDIIVYSKSFEQHMDELDKVFTALSDAVLKLNAPKCFFGVNRVTYLGHIISKHGIEVDPDKVQAVRDFPVPRNTTEVRAFNDLCNYFRRFIPHFGETAKALKDLCNKDAKLRWKDIQQLVSDHLKNLYCVAPVLAYPDFNTHFYLATDASVTGLGAVIYQL
jgi:Reverse transcriptase (RNA-dependent DNA polymerase)/RNase H-like domain found in reverse transcriptase